MRVTLTGSWELVTIKQFCEISRIKESKLDNIQKLVEIISVLSGIDSSIVSTFSVKDIKTASQAISYIYQDLPTNIQEEFIIDGVKYKGCFDLRKITAGQYLDLKTYTENPNEIIYNMHNILSVLYVPEGKKYNEVPSNEVAEIFYNNTLASAGYSASVFFCQLFKELKTTMAGCLINRMANQMRPSIHIGNG